MMRLRTLRAGTPGAILVAVVFATAHLLLAAQGRRVVSLPGAPASIYSPAVAADGLIYTASVQSPDPAQPEGDVGAETRRVLERLGQVLTASGSSLGQVASMSVYLKRPTDFDAMNAVYREFVTGSLPVRTTVVTELANRAQVEMSAIAVPAGAPREAMHPAGWMKSPRPYSYIVRAGGLVFLAGLVSRRGIDDQIVPGSIAVQTRTILDNAGVLLKTAGLTYDDVVAARIFLTDDTLFEGMNGEYRKYFHDKPPARSTAIAGLVGTSETQIEITLIASAIGKQTLGPQLAPTLPVSSAVRAGSYVFLSGVLGETDTNHDNVAAQSREALLRVGKTLEAAGVTFADVVDSTIYVTDIWQREKVDEVFGEFFPRQPPARTMVGAKLSTRNAAVEMLLTVVK